MSSAAAKEKKQQQHRSHDTTSLSQQKMKAGKKMLNFTFLAMCYFSSRKPYYGST
jgi:hypothetical protein